MTEEMGPRIMYTFVILGFQIAVIVATATDKPASNSEDECKFWKELPEKLSNMHDASGGSINMQCADNGCTEVECTGHLQQWLLQSAKMTEDFCFGVRLNHCDSPVSMNYYLDVPSKNFSHNGNVTQNSTLKVPKTTYYHFGVGVDVNVQLDPVNSSYIKFGITVSVKIVMPLNHSPTWSEIPVLPPMLIATPPCNNAQAAVNQTTFTGPSTCVAAPFVTQKPPVTTTIAFKSKTYKQACEIGLEQCGENEMCAHSNDKGRGGLCLCAKGAPLSPITGMCEPTQPSSTTKATTKAPIPFVTQASTGKGKKSSQTLKIVIPSIVGGLLLIVVIGCVIVYIGRRRRLQRSTPRGHRLLADNDDDDDDNLVI